MSKAGDPIQRFSESTHMGALNKACKMMKFKKKLNSFSSRLDMAGLSSPVVPLEKGSMPRFSFTSKLGLASYLEPSFSKNWLRGVAADSDLSEMVTMSTCNPGAGLHLGNCMSLCKGSPW